MAKKMLIDATHPEETRVVVVDGNRVEDFDYESINKRQLAGNIYLAKVTRVEPSLQAAFVDYGGNRHGFLAFSEIHPDYYQIPVADREALLAEEARDEAERRAREDERGDDDAQEGRSRKRSRRARSAPADAPDPKDADNSKEAKSEIAGLEVIEIDGVDDGSAPESLSFADPEPAGAEETTAVNDEAAEPSEPADAIVDEPSGNTSLAEADAPTAEEQAPSENDSDVDVAATAAENTETGPDDGAPGAVAQTDNDPDSSSGGDDTPPRSIAESTGLDDDERLTGEIEDAERRRVEGEADVEATDPAPADTAQDEAIPEEPDAASAGTDQAEHSDDGPSGDAENVTGEPDAASEVVEPAQETSSVSEEVEADGADLDAMAAETEASDVEAAPETTEAEAFAPDEDSAGSGEDDSGTGRSGRRSRRRRRGRRDDKEERTADAEASESESEEDEQVDTVGAEDTLEEAASVRLKLRRRYKIQDVVKVRQIMLVQVVKEERGNKGAALTTYLSLAGRYCVLMPNTARGGGISRKITNAPDRKRLREITAELDVPTGMGLIVRTAGAERTRPEIKRDYEFLLRQWEQVRELTLKSIAPCLIYEEGSLIKRSIRDIYSKEIDQILVEGENGYREAKEYMKMLMPSHAKNVQPYAEQTPLYTRYQVESYLNGMFNPVVQLKSGGYIVIGVTEALVAIDVNSGRSTKEGSIENTALKTNLEASDEVARQLRLRDLAGLIVIDFIDMEENRNNRAVEKRMKERLKTDRARIQVGRISAFGLMEMSRQRLRPGMLEATTTTCPHCEGMGFIRSDESLALAILREVEEEGVKSRTSEVTVRAPVEIANYVINQKRDAVAQIEQRHGIQINVFADQGLMNPHYEIKRDKNQVQGRRPIAQPAVITAESVAMDEDFADDMALEEDLVQEPVAPEGEADGESKSKRRRGRRGGRRRRNDDEGNADQAAEEAAEAKETDDDTEGDGEGKSRSRRSRSRGGRGRRKGRRDEEVASDSNPTPTAPDTEQQEVSAGEAEVGPDAPDASDDTPLPEPSADPDPAAGELEPVVAEDATAEDAPADPKALPADPDAIKPAERPLEPLAAEPSEPPAPEAEQDPRSKRRGWWSLGF